MSPTLHRLLIAERLRELRERGAEARMKRLAEQSATATATATATQSLKPGELSYP